MFGRLLFSVLSIIGYCCMAFAMFVGCVLLYALIAVGEVRQQRLARSDHQ
jgi:hypothetical protein